MKQLPTLMLALFSNVAAAVPLSTVGTFCSTFPSQCQKGTESLMAVRGTGTNAYYVLEADPTTGALPVNITGGSVVVTVASDGPTGAAVPADASYGGLNNGGTLIGAIGDSSGRTIVAGAGTAGSANGGVLTVQGVASMTPLLVNGSGSTQPVSGTVTANEGGAPWTVTGTGSAGSAAVGVLTVQGIASGTALTTDASTAAATFQDGSIAFGSLTTSYQTVVATGGSVRIVQLRNNTDAVIVVSLDGGSTTSYTLDAGDTVSDDLKSSGRSIAVSTNLQAKYSGSAPTLGSIRINVVY